MGNTNTRKFLRNFKRTLLSFIMFATFFACNTEDEKVTPAEDLSPLIAYLESTGFSRDEIVYKDGIFIIDEDILISKEDVHKYVNGATSVPSNSRTEHYRGYLVSNTYVTNIKFFIQSNVPSDWKTAIRSAISQWNAVNGTRLYLSEVTNSSSAHVQVNTAYANANWVAQAYLPTYNGRPGHTLTINTKYNYLSSSYKLFTIVHEMGHNFGLYHTDQTQGIFIQGTPSSDPNSVMNSYVLPWNGFTSGDRKAVQLMYPQ